MLVLILVGVMAALAGVLLWMLEQRYSMWRSRGVPGPVASIFSPAIPKTLLGQENMGDIADRTYRDYHDHPVAGTYLLTTPVLHLHDPEVIKQVLIKEFQDFNGRGVVAEADWDPLTSHLFFISGQRWRNLRVKLAPTFTTGKIKYMFNTIRQSSEQLADYLAEKVVAGGGSHVEDARLLMMRLFVDTIASVAFGIESNTVKDPVNSEFFKAAHEAVEPSRSNALRALMSFFARDLMRWLRIKGVAPATDKFFRNVVRETVEYREKNNVERADMLNLLIQLKNKGYVAADNGESPAKEDGGNKERITQDEIAAQVFIFFVAGFESSSSTTSFTLYEMAKNPAIYDKAVKEIDQVLKEHNGEITYDAIMAMPYLERAINETLRMYPPLAFITREAMVSRQVPGTGVVVDKGTRVVVPVRALHYDPQYWPEPEKYDPDRFTDENKSTRPSSVYMPFGEGPRMCIAARLGVVQVKTALVTLLSRYRVSPCPGAKSKVKLNPRSFATTPSGDLNVRFHPRVAAA